MQTTDEIVVGDQSVPSSASSGERIVTQTLDLENKELLAQGAEGRVFLLKNYFGKQAIMKERFSKKYRHPTLDSKLTKQRLVKESKNISKCRQLGIEVPTVYNVDKTNNLIFMEYIEGCSVKEYFRKFEQLANASTEHIWDESCLEIAHSMGKVIATIHKNKLVHGDLTTSNLMLRNGEKDKLVVIDFGLSFGTTLDEDKAVDLYVLERALLSTHPNSEKLFDQLIEGYKIIDATQSKTVLKKLDQVRQRGRKKSMIG
ncbi:protein kinase [Naegleria gruberi]|uniref:non-specific serine/threonine protein kinase n=1 Tax=Naegleria gruberi TaxID=5762 RepID=D2VD79_NAEGR|nr:protein kinase [Naegleria gruberi]EFC45185.1 protein kinase [Naegleria gruberi]|eukprot:XP_002677929.1 protein kinase [Naegleria gruberi]